MTAKPFQLWSVSYKFHQLFLIEQITSTYLYANATHSDCSISKVEQKALRFIACFLVNSSSIQIHFFQSIYVAKPNNSC